MSVATPEVSERPSAKALPFVLPAALWCALFFVLPLAVMAVYSFWLRAGGKVVKEGSFANYVKFFGRDYLLQSLFNSLEITLLTAAVSLLLAYPLAAILAFRVPPRWQGVGIALAILPFWTSYVVRSYSWLLVLSEGGVVNTALLGIGLIDEPLKILNNRTATVLVFVHFFTMLMALTIFVNLRQIPVNYIRAAADLGASKLQIFWRIVLPLSVPGVMVGVFLTIVIAIGDYVTPQIVGGNKELVMPQAIMLQVSRRADIPMASAMSMVLMLVVSLVFLGFARWLRMERV